MSSRIALENKIENYSQGLEYTPTSLPPVFCSECSHDCLWVVSCSYVISSFSLGHMKLSSAAIPKLVLGLREMPSLKRLM